MPISPSLIRETTLAEFSAAEAAARFLHKKSTPKIYYAGNLSLLTEKSIGFCGSRDASDHGVAVAAECASEAAKAGFVVISGNARGVDVAAHQAALLEGGKTILVLAEGMSHFSIRRDLSAHWDWDRVLVLSHYSPEIPWTVYRAMERNGLIVALSQAMIVIEAREKGGTFHAGEAALKAKKPLFVAAYEDMSAAGGNELLLKKGGIMLGRDPETHRPNIKKITEAIKNWKEKDLLSFLQ